MTWNLVWMTCMTFFICIYISHDSRILVGAYMLCVAILFHHLVCVCVLHINCVYVFTFPYYHYIFVVFTYQSPSNSAHLLWSISFLSSTIAHLIHFADHSPPPYLLYLVILIWHCHSVFHITLSRGFMKGLRQETVPSCEGRIQKEYPAMKKQSPAIRYLRKSQSIFEIFSITLKYLK